MPRGGSSPLSRWRPTQRSVWAVRCGPVSGCAAWRRDDARVDRPARGARPGAVAAGPGGRGPLPRPGGGGGVRGDSSVGARDDDRSDPVPSARRGGDLGGGARPQPAPAGVVDAAAAVAGCPYDRSPPRPGRSAQHRGRTAGRAFAGSGVGAPADRRRGGGRGRGHPRTAAPVPFPRGLWPAAACVGALLVWAHFLQGWSIPGWPAARNAVVIRSEGRALTAIARQLEAAARTQGLPEARRAAPDLQALGRQLSGPRVSRQSALGLLADASRQLQAAENRVARRLG